MPHKAEVSGKSVRILLELWQLEEILDKRLGEGHKLEDLFFIWSTHATKPDPGFSETFIQTKHGPLKTFFLPDLQPDKAFILHKAKFPYPKASNYHGQDYDLPSGYDRNGDLIQKLQRIM
jgi:hypothetical protein